MTTINIAYTGVPVTNTKMRTIYATRDGSVVINGGDWVNLTVTEQQPPTDYCSLVACALSAWIFLAAVANFI